MTQRGRPRNVERRRTIARAALAAFARHGYDGATMHEIAAASGITDSLLYRYYPTKQALLDDVVDAVVVGIRDVERDLRDAAAHLSSLRSFLRAAADIWIGYLVAFGDWFAVRFTGLPIPPARLEELHAGYEKAMNAAADRIRGTPSARDPSVVARMFAGAIFSFVMFQAKAGHEPPSPAVREAYIDELVELLVDALTPASRR